MHTSKSRKPAFQVKNFPESSETLPRQLVLYPERNRSPAPDVVSRTPRSATGFDPDEPGRGILFCVQNLSLDG